MPGRGSSAYFPGIAIGPPRRQEWCQRALPELPRVSHRPQGIAHLVQRLVHVGGGVRVVRVHDGVDHHPALQDLAVEAGEELRVAFRVAAGEAGPFGPRWPRTGRRIRAHFAARP